MPAKRVALVTGAAGGIGRAAVQVLLRDGIAVFATDRALASLPCAFDAAFDAFSADVTDEAQVTAAIVACRKRFGGLDAVVHLAGASGKGPLSDVSLAETLTSLGTSRPEVTRSRFMFSAGGRDAAHYSDAARVQGLTSSRRATDYPAIRRRTPCD